MNIGFRDTSENASVVLGVLSGFNLWNHAIAAEEILRMSHGCGSEAGDVKAWKTVRKGLKKEVAVEWFRTCSDRQGKLSKRIENDSHRFHCFQAPCPPKHVM